MWTRSVTLVTLLFLPLMGGIATAQPLSAGPSIQTFALATSNEASCVNPPGPCGPLMSLPITLTRNSLLTITFSARGTVVQPPMTAIVETTINCDVDGNSCDPDDNGVQSLYPADCCDTRSFTWVALAPRGHHTVNISWTTNNMGTSLIQNRTLHVEAAAAQ
jgi:hypothetical protein